METAQQTKRVMRIEEVTAVVGLQKTAIYDLIKRNDFPASIVLTEGRGKNGERVASRVGWWQHEVERWLEQRAEASRKQPLPKRAPRVRRTVKGTRRVSSRK